MRPWMLSIVLTSLAVTGCGNGLSTVSGRITFNGEAVNRGAITLIPKDGKGQAAGSSVENGSYSIKDVTPGEKTVQIYAVYPMGTKKEADGTEIELVGDLLPSSWGPTSQNTMTVTGPRTTKDFPIEGPDPRTTK